MAAKAPPLVGPFWWLDAALVAVGTVLVAIPFVTGVAAAVEAVVEPLLLARVGVYAVLAGSSSLIVAVGLREFTGDDLTEGADVDEDTGWLIGKLENVLVLTFVFGEAYTALSIVFAAKSFVRREDIASGNTTYYVAGTLLNFTYSVVVGLVAIRLLGL